MKSQLRKFLATLVFALAIGSAFANSFVSPPDPVLKKKIGANWITVPAGEHHRCDAGAPECTALFNGTTMVPGSLVTGTYVVTP